MKIEIEISDNMIDNFIEKMECEEEIVFDKMDIVEFLKKKLYDEYSDGELGLLEECLYDMWNNDYFENN